MMKKTVKQLPLHLVLLNKGIWLCVASNASSLVHISLNNDLHLLGRNNKERSGEPFRTVPDASIDKLVEYLSGVLWISSQNWRTGLGAAPIKIFSLPGRNWEVVWAAMLN